MHEMTSPIRSMPEDEAILIDGKYEAYRVVTDMEALHEGFRDRVEDLEITRSELDAISKLQTGYSAKLLCNPPMKTIGKASLPKMLQATGMALVLVIDDERFAPIKAALTKRQRPVRPNGSMKRPAWLITREASQNMQNLRNQKLTPRQRKMIAKKAAKTRWRMAKERERVTT